LEHREYSEKIKYIELSSAVDVVLAGATREEKGSKGGAD
jgi:hypothetical protein